MGRFAHYMVVKSAVVGYTWDMIYARPSLTHDPDTLPRMPTWVTSARPETPEDVAFLSGAALATLHVVVGREDVPQALLRERLALQAAEACVGYSGRPERAGELRDAVHLLRPDDLPGPAGEIYLAWRRAVERSISIKALHRALPGHAAEQIATWLDCFEQSDRCDRRAVGQGGHIARASATLETVFSQTPHEEATALIHADAVLATALGWEYVVPLLGVGLKRRDLRKSGEELRLACHQAVIRSASEAVRLAVDLTHRAARLQGIAHKLRAKGAGAAVEIFLARDAVTPAALASPARGIGLSDRAARRLCDRLVELGVVQELSGRATFRLYGV